MPPPADGMFSAVRDFDSEQEADDSTNKKDAVEMNVIGQQGLYIQPDSNEIVREDGEVGRTEVEAWLTLVRLILRIRKIKRAEET